ncbi:MAG: DUF115 domain-containing protein [Candidatus Nanoarchaeia archaeon]|nr:DUF115 domain-containing protein [Candidatus Nanoarchaeia archaeon]
MSEFQNPVFRKMQEPAHIEYPCQVMFGVNENQMIDNVVVKVDDQFMAVGVTDNEAWMQNINPAMHTIIVFGLGLGYHIESLIQKYPDKKIIAVEPDIRILNHAMQVKDFENIIKGCEIWVDESVDLVRSRIYEMITHPLARGILLIPFYAGVYQDYFNELIGWMKKSMNDWAVMVNTKRCLVDKWYVNRFVNAKRPSLHGKSLIDAHRGLPGMVVGAGPSLAGQLEKLRSLQGKVVTIAASTAMEILHTHEIRPTYAIAIDQDPITSGGLHEHLDSDVPLIFDGQIAQNSLEYKGPKVQMRLNVNQYITSDLPVFESGPSVANVSVDVLHKMGCNPIILVGMDLSYTDNKLYCGGTQFNQDIVGTQYIKMTNNKGEECLTEPSFISMRNWLEEYVARVKPEIYNCTERGLIIQGCPNRSLDEFVFDREIVTPEFEPVDMAGVEKINSDMTAELLEAKTFIETNRAVNPAFQKFRSWILVDEYVQTNIYLAEIRCESRIREGMDKRESVKIFQDRRIELILEAVNRLLELLK